MVILVAKAGCLRAQDALNSRLASLVSGDHYEVVDAKSGMAVFTDADTRFNQLPEVLKRTAFIRGPKKTASTILPITTGRIFVVTPSAGLLGSKDSLLRHDGFERLPISVGNLFTNQNDSLSLYTKKLDYKSFRLAPLSIGCWVVFFFSPDSLQSRQVPAKLTAVIPAGFEKSSRRWQGCPSIEKTGKRLWASWFSGGNREPDAGNYGIVAYSDDDGKSWRDPAIIIAHSDTNVRVMDPQLWKDPEGKLWIFWVQNEGAHGFDGLWSTWAVQLKHPNAGRLSWTKPKRLCDGLTRNKPIVLDNGAWLLPSYSWVPDYRSSVYLSIDRGKTWILQGGPRDSGSQNFYEHMVVELKDKRLWLLQRNIQQSYSTDIGRTWTNLTPVDGMTSANSRLYLGRLRSGRLLLVYNNDEQRTTRRNLTAFISEDDGKSWPNKLVIDERNDISYPDVIQDGNGKIYLCYDRGRTTDKEIILAEFGEDDVVKGKFPEGYKLKLISKVD